MSDTDEQLRMYRAMKQAHEFNKRYFSRVVVGDTDA